MRSGSVESTPTTPIANPDPVRSSTRIGIAVFVIASPNELIPWPNRTTRKSRFWRSSAGVSPTAPETGGAASWRRSGSSSTPGGPAWRSGAWASADDEGGIDVRVPAAPVPAAFRPVEADEDTPGEYRSRVLQWRQDTEGGQDRQSHHDQRQQRGAAGDQPLRVAQ